MKALCVDDEHLLLDTLLWAVKQSPDIEEAVGFEDETDALEWAREHHVDAAFVDVELHEMSGLELARELRNLQPDIYIIFCTGHSQYALEAFDIHANGYLMKPITPEQVQKEISYIKNMTEKRQEPLITVRRYGNFSVYDRYGNVVEFKRTKTKELLALLIHTHGMEMGFGDLCRYLWQDNNVMRDNNRKYLWNLMSDLRLSLEKIGAADVLGKSRKVIYVNMALIELNDIGIGEYPYMSGYEWAEGGPLEEMN